MEWVLPDRVIDEGDPRRERAFLRSSEHVRARYLRCRSAWSSHLERSRAAIERGMGRCAHRGSVFILGGGMLHDVPLDRLASEFSRVVIVDVVHLWRSVLAARRYGNVEQLCLDVSGYSSGDAVKGRAPSVGVPVDLFELGGADFVVSLNLLSQLAVIPRLAEGSKMGEEEFDALGRQMVANHLSVLDRLGGEVTLITDSECWEVYPESGRRSAKEVLFGMDVGPFEEEWDWQIAPIPEAAMDHHVIHRVGVRHWTGSRRGKI